MEKNDDSAAYELIAGAIGKKVKKINRRKSFISFAVTVVVTAAAAYILFGLVFGVAMIHGGSMAPSISSGSPLVYLRTVKSYVRGDVVIFSEPDGGTSVRRIAAAAGDTVDINDETGEIIINGITEKNSSVVGKTYSYPEGISFPLTVKEGEVFVLGDSREGCVDSRLYGCVKCESLIGRVILELKLFSR